MGKLRMVAMVAALVALSAAAMAAPTITRLDVGGVAQVLRAPVGGFANTTQSGRVAYHFDNDRIYWSGHASSGHSYFWVDPTLTGDLGGAHDSSTGAVRSYTNPFPPPPVVGTIYAGTVTGGVLSALDSGNVGMAYLPPEATVLTKGGTGNNAPIRSFRAATSVGGVDVLGEGTNASKVNSGQHRYNDGSNGLTTGSFHIGLAYLGEDATNYDFLFINQWNGASQNGWTMHWSKTPATPVGAATVGVRTLTRTSGTVSSTQLGDLVPGVADYVQAIANDLAGNIYVLSRAVTGSNYLSAFSLTGGYSPLDLNPDATMYVDLTGLITNTAGDTNISGHGLAVNGDASLIYIAASSGSTSTPDNIFVFESNEILPVAEPAGLSLVGLALLAIRKRRS